MNILDYLLLKKEDSIDSLGWVDFKLTVPGISLSAVVIVNLC